jgi:hypothetical protein
MDEFLCGRFVSSKESVFFFLGILIDLYNRGITPSVRPEKKGGKRAYPLIASNALSALKQCPDS